MLGAIPAGVNTSGGAAFSKPGGKIESGPRTHRVILYVRLRSNRGNRFRGYLDLLRGRIQLHSELF